MFFRRLFDFLMPFHERNGFFGCRFADKLGDYIPLLGWHVDGFEFGLLWVVHLCNDREDGGMEIGEVGFEGSVEVVGAGVGEGIDEGDVGLGGGGEVGEGSGHGWIVCVLIRDRILRRRR